MAIYYDDNNALIPKEKAKQKRDKQTVLVKEITNFLKAISDDVRVQ